MRTFIAVASMFALQLVLAPTRAGEPQTLAYDEVSMTGRVVAVDADAGTFTMLDGVGNETTLASPSPILLQALSPGVAATVIYRRAIAVDIQPDGGHGAYRLEEPIAPTDETNAGGEREIVTVLAPITGIDTKRNVLSVRAPTGHIIDLDVTSDQDRQRLHKLKVGQALRVRFTHARIVRLQIGNTSVTSQR